MSRIAFLATVLKGWNFLRRRLMIFSDTIIVRLHEILQIILTWSARPKTSNEPTKYPVGQDPGDSHWLDYSWFLVFALLTWLLAQVTILSSLKTGRRCCIGSWAY